jgi:hypothetical protein
VVIEVEKNRQLDCLTGRGSGPEKSGWGPFYFCYILAPEDMADRIRRFSSRTGT